MNGEGVRGPSRRRTFGLLIDWISTPYHMSILDGLLDLCQHIDANVVVLVTGRIGSDWQSERCRNVLAQLAHDQTMDGLIVCASSLQNFAGHEALHDFLKGYRLPMVTLHERFEGIPAVLVDNATGIREVLDHLVDSHGHRRIAFLKGPEGSLDSQSRFEAYSSYLAQKGLPADPQLVLHGDFSPVAGAAAITTLAGLGSDLPDVLVCANDSMALGAMKECSRRGWELPLVGFDNSAPGLRAGLTTVHQSITAAVETAAELLLQMMSGQTVPAATFVPTKLVLRRSCGTHGAPSPTLGAGVPGEDDREWELSDFDLEDLYNVGESLFARIDKPEDFHSVFETLPGVGIDRCWVVRYDDAADPMGFSHLVVAYDRGRPIRLDAGGMQFPTRALLPPGLLADGDRYAVMVQSLFQGPEQIGYVVFQIGTRKWRAYEILRKELSSAYKASGLISALRDQAASLEAMVALRTRELTEANTQLRLEILERMRVESELSHREAHFREMAQMLPTIVLELDLRGRIGFINQAGLRILEFASEEAARTKTFLDCVHEEDRDQVSEWFDGIVERHVTQSGEFRLRSADGQTVVILCEASPILRNKILRGIRVSAMNIRPLLASMVQPDELFFRHYEFTPRVKEVLQLMVQGYSTPEIGDKLGISENTVKAHIRAIYIEVGVEKRSEFFEVLKDYQAKHFGRQSFVFTLFSDMLKRA